MASDKAQNDALSKLLGSNNAIEKVVDGLIKDWKAKKPGVWNARKPRSNGVIVDGVRKLLSSGTLDPSDFLGATSVAGRVKLAKAAIEKFQRRFDMEKPDGIFGRKTANRIKDCNACNPWTGRETKLKNSSASKKHNAVFDNLAKLFVHVSQPVIKRFDAQFGDRQTLEIITNSIHAWIKHIDLSLKFATDLDDANIVVVLDQIDGRSGTILADAPVGGPRILNGNQVKFRIDEEEHFDKQKFTYMMMHEFGHVLGISHTNVDSSDLMGPVINLGVTEPQPRDIDALKSKWPR
jgi:hypothetical protein